MAPNQDRGLRLHPPQLKEVMMSIITISKGSYSYGTEVAEKLAEKLGYECVSREVLLDASHKFNIPEIKLVKAIEDPPSFLDRLFLGKEKYISYVRSAFLKRILYITDLQGIFLLVMSLTYVR